MRERGSNIFRQFHTSLPTTFVADELSPAIIRAKDLGLQRTKVGDVARVKQIPSKKHICCLPECFAGKIRHFSHSSGLSRHIKQEHAQATKDYRKNCKKDYLETLMARLEDESDAESEHQD